MHRSFAGLLTLGAGLLAAACKGEFGQTGGLTPPGDTTGDTLGVATTTPGSPVPNLSQFEREVFNRGMLVFVTNFTPQSGLGPLFNATSCGTCHDEPAMGGYGDTVEVPASAWNGRSCNTLDAVGGPIVQQHTTPLLQSALGILREPTPPGATGTSLRSTPLIFGLGLLDAVPDRTIRQLARIRYPEGVRGHPAILADGRIGRFGRKANIATLDEFNAGAFFNEMGITNRLHPVEGTVAGQPLPAGVDPAPDPELNDTALIEASTFVKLLAPVAPLPPTQQTEQGQELFDQTRCTSCHLPVLQTGASQIRALRFKRVKAYTDLLLHDMGPEDSDICIAAANPREFRTQPLMGARFLDMFMHDGLAETVPQAIERHGGEASTARGLFRSLSPQDQAALVAFVMSL